MAVTVGQQEFFKGDTSGKSGEGRGYGYPFAIAGSDEPKLVAGKTRNEYLIRLPISYVGHCLLRK